MLQQVPFNILFPRIEPLEPFYLPSIQGGLSSKDPYHMLDLYCQDYACDCHKVSIAILDEKQETVLATIAYGWKSRTYYYKWGLDKDTAESLTSGFLDPWAIQTVHGSVFLDFVRRKINREPQFMNKIKKRYRIFKDHTYSPFFEPIVAPPQSLPDNVVSLNAHRCEKA